MRLLRYVCLDFFFDGNTLDQAGTATCRSLPACMVGIGVPGWGAGKCERREVSRLARGEICGGGGAIIVCSSSVFLFFVVFFFVVILLVQKNLTKKKMTLSFSDIVP